MIEQPATTAGYYSPATHVSSFWRAPPRYSWLPGAGLNLIPAAGKDHRPSNGDLCRVESPCCDAAGAPGHFGRRDPRAFGFEMREFPVDIAVIVGSVFLTALTYSKQMEFYKGLGMSDAQLQQMLDMQQTADLSIMGATFAILAIVSWMRRKKLGRA
jgi:hypothetical protein